MTLSLYLVGLGCGPFVFAPLSELYGRQRAYVVSMIGELMRFALAIYILLTVVVVACAGFTLMNLGCCFVDRCVSCVLAPVGGSFVARHSLRFSSEQSLWHHCVTLVSPQSF